MNLYFLYIQTLKNADLLQFLHRAPGISVNLPRRYLGRQGARDYHRDGDRF